MKVDTATADEPWRSRYLALLDPDYDRMPFVALLSAELGVTMSLEELVSWSIAAIDAFEIGYWEVGRLLGLPTGGLRRLSEQADIRRWFEVWRDAMFEGASGGPRTRWLPDCRLVARPGTAPDGRLRVQLGDDPSGERWAVEINEPLASSGHNSLSAIGIDGDGRHYLLRQGMLRPQVTGGDTIGTDLFAERSRLPIVVVDDVGKAAERSWYIVAPLEASAMEVRRGTATFVEACARVRGWDPSADPSGAGGYDATEESGDSYFTGPRGPVDQQEVRRRQGIVWLKLKDILQPHGIAVGKTRRHRQGFQVDAIIGEAGRMRLLVEIKTSISSADIHGGVGQLHLYPKLIPEASGLKPILLLPRRPSEEVVRSVREVGIASHYYDFGDGSAEGIIFDADFLAECGVGR